MKAVIQRVAKASVTINNSTHASIEKGIVVLLGIANNDSENEINYIIKKIINLRIFDDNLGIMNRSLNDIAAEVLVISQFTLMARTKKGNRPSYIDAAPADISKPIYTQFVTKLIDTIGKERVKEGQFGADMQVSLVNDGPVTIIINTNDNQQEQ